MLFLYKLIMLGALALIVAGCDSRQTGTAATPSRTTIGTEIDDGIIAAKVKSSLIADADVKSFEIKVEVHKGEVQLSGFVDNQMQIDRATKIAYQIEGVKGIQNNMTLKEGKISVGTRIDDSIITSQVKSALLADANIKSLDISVATRKGEVQLSGFVDNKMQIDRAIDLARRIDGVQNVINEMSIKK